MAAAKGKKREKKADPKEDKGKGGNQKNTCFTIMPFGGGFDLIYSKVYFPAESF